MEIKEKIKRRYLRRKRVRAKVFGTLERPRLSVFRSNQHIYVQAIDDTQGRTLASASDLELKDKPKEKPAKVKDAFEVGKLIAQKLLKLNIKKAVFDRGGYKYHGQVKALAEGARKGGLEF